MNRKLVRFVKATEFFCGKTHRLLNAIVYTQELLRTFKPDEIVSEVEPKLAIRDELTRYYAAKSVVTCVSKNKGLEIGVLLSKVIDECVANRSIMAGCCHDCFINVYDNGEYDYILHNKVWKKAAKKDHDKLLCSGCVEERLGRKLKFKDFNWEVPLNYIDGDRSYGLLERMAR